MLTLMLVVFGAGVVGGILNALISDNGFVLPQRTTTGQAAIIRPGFLGNMLVGGVAGIISWGLYGPFSDAVVIGASTANGAEPHLTVAALAGVLLVGVGGARWLTNEVDKRLLRAAATQAALRDPSDDVASGVASAPPAEALRIATESVRSVN